MGVIVAIAAFARHQRGDDLRYIVAGDHVFVFTVKGSIIMVCVASTGESPRCVSLKAPQTSRHDLRHNLMTWLQIFTNAIGLSLSHHCEQFD